jgi:hypothetical protein
MGFTEILTIIFILLKVFKVVTWAWWVVFLPEIIALVIYVAVIVLHLLCIHKTNKHMDKFFDDKF